MSNDDVFADEASSNIQNFSRQSPSVTQCSVTRHVSRVMSQGWGRVMMGVTAIIGSDLDGRQILHDTTRLEWIPSVLYPAPEWQEFEL